MVGSVSVGSSIQLSALPGTPHVARYEDGTSVGDWNLICGQTFRAFKECPTACTAYLQNNACQTLFVFKIVQGQATFVGTAAVGSSLELSALAGTPHIVRYEDGTVVGEWDLECDKTFTASQSCPTPCDDVRILAIRIFDQATDQEVPGIGDVTEGMVVDLSLIHI